MGTHGQTLPYPLPTAAALLRGERCGDRSHSLAGPLCLARGVRAEGTPARVVVFFVEAGFPAGPVALITAVAVGLRLGAAAEVANLHVFQIDHVIAAHQGEGGLVVEVGALALDLL